MLEPSCGSPDYGPGDMPAEKTVKIMLLKPGHGGFGSVMPDPGDGKIWKTCNPGPATGDLATGDLPYHAVHYGPPQPVPVQEAQQGRGKEARGNPGEEPNSGRGAEETWKRHRPS